MSYDRRSQSSLDTLSPVERAILEYSAEGLSDREIVIRSRVTRREIAAIRRHIAVKLAGRLASAHPFQISEVVLAGSVDSRES